MVNLQINFNTYVINCLKNNKIYFEVFNSEGIITIISLLTF